MCNNWQQMFSDWLLEEMRKREWIQADLARASGLTTASISRYMVDRVPDKEALRKIARAFNMKPEIIFRAAGILPPERDSDETSEQILYEVHDLTKQEKEEVLAFIRMKKNFRKNNGH